MSQVIDPKVSDPAPRRENVFDIMRGLSIVGVVYIHGAYILAPTVPPLLDPNYFRWAVPLFLILSALFSVRSLQKRPTRTRGFLARRYRKLLIPYLAYSLLYFFLKVDWQTLTLQKAFTSHLIGYGWTGQYFFIVLFQLLPLYPWLNRINWTSSKLIGVIILALAVFPLAAWVMMKSSTINKIADLLFFCWLPYSVVGVFFAQHEELFAKLPKRFLPWIAGVVTVCCPGLVLLENRFANPSRQSYLLDSVLVASLFLFGFMPSVLSRVKPQIASTLSLLGRYSLGVFCLNPLIVIGLNWIVARIGGATFLPPLAQMLSAFVIVPFICLCCLWLSKAIEAVGGRDLVA